MNRLAWTTPSPEPSQTDRRYRPPSVVITVDKAPRRLFGGGMPRPNQIHKILSTRSEVSPECNTPDGRWWMTFKEHGEAVAGADEFPRVLEKSDRKREASKGGVGLYESSQMLEPGVEWCLRWMVWKPSDMWTRCHMVLTKKPREDLQWRRG